MSNHFSRRCLFKSKTIPKYLGSNEARHCTLPFQELRPKAKVTDTIYIMKFSTDMTSFPRHRAPDVNDAKSLNVEVVPLPHPLTDGSASASAGDSTTSALAFAASHKPKSSHCSLLALVSHWNKLEGLLVILILILPSELLKGVEVLTCPQSAQSSRKEKHSCWERYRVSSSSGIPRRTS